MRAAFRKSPCEAGYSEGQDVTMNCVGPNRLERLPELQPI